MLNLILDRHSGTPVYRQIVDQVRFQAASGGAPPGTVLPSTRGLAATHRVNPMTVSKAYSELERDGVIERRPGLPSIIAERPAKSEQLDRDGELRSLLAPVARAAGQLGIDRARALELFDSELDELEAESGESASTTQSKETA